MGFLVWVVANAIAVGFAAWIFDDITVTGDTTTDRVLTLLLIGLIFGLVNSVVRPIVNLLSLPLIILSLGLMLVVTNALMLLLTSKIAEWLDIGFHVEGFWTAIWASVVISITSMVIDAVLPD